MTNHSETPKWAEEILPKLKMVYDEIGQDMQYFKTGLDFTKILVEQGHSAESIAAYLHLHCGVYAGVEATKQSLIKHGIGKVEAVICETCGDVLNKDGLCNICDNYLYDHEE